MPLTLPPAADSPRVARRYVGDALTRLGYEDLVETGVLGVDELVTNACLHARTPLTVCVTMGPDGAPRIEVADASDVLPMQRPVSQTAATGRGLRLLSAAGRWGVDPSSTGGKTVWFEPAVDMDAAAFAFSDWEGGV